MPGKTTLLFFVGMVALLSVSLTEVDSVAVSVSIGLPVDAFKYAAKKTDDWFSCSRYDGYAACFHRNGGKDKRDREVKNCQKANIWDYRHTFGGTCWCFRCA